MAQPNQGLVQDAGRPAGTFGAGERSALFCPPLAGQVAQPLAQRRGCGDQDRSQRGAGRLGRGGGVVTVDHRQPQRLPVPVGTHLRRVRAGEQLTRRADGVDRVAFARAALADVRLAPISVTCSPALVR